MTIHIHNSVEHEMYLAGWQYLAGKRTKVPLAREAGDGGEGGRGEAHQHVRQRHVADKQVDAGVQTRSPANGDKHFIYIFFSRLKTL